MTKSTSVIAILQVAMVLFCVAVAQANDLAYPYQSNLQTGWTNRYSRTDNTIRWANRDPDSTQYKRRGWSNFDLTGLPARPSSYSRVDLHYYQTSAANGPTATLRYVPNVTDPTYLTAGQLYDTLATGKGIGTVGAPGNLPGWVARTLPDSIRSMLPNFNMFVSWCEESDPPPMRSGAADGWQDNDPYLEFIP